MYNANPSSAREGDFSLDSSVALINRSENRKVYKYIMGLRSKAAKHQESDEMEVMNSIFLAEIKLLIRGRSH